MPSQKVVSFQASCTGIRESRTTSNWMGCFQFCFSSRMAPLGGCFFGLRCEGITLWQACVSKAVGRGKGVQGGTLLFIVCASSYLLLVPVGITSHTIHPACGTQPTLPVPRHIGTGPMVSPEKQQHQQAAPCAGGKILPLQSRAFQLGLRIKLL